MLILFRKKSASILYVLRGHSMQLKSCTILTMRLLRFVRVCNGLFALDTLKTDLKCEWLYWWCHLAFRKGALFYPMLPQQYISDWVVDMRKINLRVTVMETHGRRWMGQGVFFSLKTFAQALNLICPHHFSMTSFNSVSLRISFHHANHSGKLNIYQMHRTNIFSKWLS